MNEKIKIIRKLQEDLSAPPILLPETPIDYSRNPDVSIEGDFFIVKYNKSTFTKRIALFLIRLLRKL